MKKKYEHHSGHWKNATDEELVELAQLFKSPTAISNACRQGYREIVNRELQDNAYARMKGVRRLPGYWQERTDEELVAFAKHFDTPTELASDSSQAVLEIRKRSLEEQAYALMNLTKKPPNYWTFERRFEAAQPYSTITEFREGDPPAYAATNLEKNRHEREMIYAHFVPEITTYTDEQVVIISQFYPKVSHLQKECPGIYKQAIDRDLEDEAFKYMDTSRRNKLPENTWTKDMVWEVAERIEFKNDWKLSNDPYEQKALSACRRFGSDFYKEVMATLKNLPKITDEELIALVAGCKHRSEAQNHSNSKVRNAYRTIMYRSKNDSTLKDRALGHMKYKLPLIYKYLYLIRFPDNVVYIGVSNNLDDRLRRHLKNKKCPVYKHWKETNHMPTIEKIYDELFLLEFALELEVDFIALYRKYDDYKVINRSNGGEKGYWVGRISEKKVREVAAKIEKLSIFNSPKYRKYMKRAKRLEIFYEVTAHMERKWAPRWMWEDNDWELIRSKIKSCDTKREFATREDCKAACSVAKKYKVYHKLWSETHPNYGGPHGVIRPKFDYYDEIESKKVADQFETVQQFSGTDKKVKGRRDVYRIAHEKGILWEVCINLKKSAGLIKRWKP